MTSSSPSTRPLRERLAREIYDEADVAMALALFVEWLREEAAKDRALAASLGDPNGLRHATTVINAAKIVERLAASLSPEETPNG